MSTEIPTNTPKRAMISPALQSSSVVMLPQTPNLNDYSVSARTPMSVDGMLHQLEPAKQNLGKSILTLPSLTILSHPKPQTLLSVMPPPRNLGEEFLAMPIVTVSSLLSHHESHSHLPSVPHPQNLGEDVPVASIETVGDMHSHSEPQFHAPSTKVNQVDMMQTHHESQLHLPPPQRTMSSTSLSPDHR
jgi:hypothetical protein